jgi:hypothetical protein
MHSSRGVGATLVVLALALPGVAPAQSARTLLDRAIQAYNALELDDAARVLTEALSDERGALAPADRLRALSYLGATELFRGRREQAVEAFRRLTILDARYRPDSLIFPPPVQTLLAEVRQTTKAVAVEVPREATITAGRAGWSIRVTPSSAHEVSVVVVASDGRPVRVIYDGTVSSAVTLGWDGLDARGLAPPNGRYELRALSRVTRESVLRSVRVPMTIRRAARAVAASPGDETMVMRARPIRPQAALIAGVAAGVLTAVLPYLVADGAEATPARFVVGGSFAVAGILAFVTGRSPPAARPETPSRPAAPVTDVVELIIETGSHVYVEGQDE